MQHKYLRLKRIIFLFSLLVFFYPTQNVNASVHRIRPVLKYRLKGLNSSVVQKTIIRPKAIYAIQEIQRKNTVISRAKRHHKNIVFHHPNALYLKNFGHTQSLDYVGNGYWLVGTTPKRHLTEYWDTEIAWIKFPNHGHKTYKSWKKLPRLTHLNYATDVKPKFYPGLRRVETAISPNHQWLLIAAIDTKDNGHFALYSFKAINQAVLAASKSKNKTVNLKNILQISAFHVKKFFGKKGHSLNSIQGYAIDNQKNIYIPREHRPTGKNSSFPREIIKIAWHQTNPKKWTHYRIDAPQWKHVATELEGLTINSSRLYLTVSYHKRNKSHKVTQNRVYYIPKVLK